MLVDALAIGGKDRIEEAQEKLRIGIEWEEIARLLV